MKKSLLAAAVIAALPAFAQAQTNVTMYGIADISVALVDAGANSRSALLIDSGGMSTSRWGVRGSEDLGGGLKAIFKFEAGVGVDDGSNDANFFQRTAQVGLSGGFGTVQFGRGYTPAFRTYGSWDAMGYGNFGNLLGLTAGAGQASTRFSNGVFYDSPSFGGLKVMFAYQAGENTASASPSSAGSGTDIAATYNGGPLNAGLFFQTTKDAAANATKRVGFGGGYQFGGFRLVGGVSSAKNDATGAKTKGVSLGGVIKMGSGSLHAQVLRADPTGNDNNTMAFGLVYRHPMSKRTTLYAQFGSARNDAGAQGSLWQSGHRIAADAAGSDVKGFGVGMRHVF